MENFPYTNSNVRPLRAHTFLYYPFPSLAHSWEGRERQWEREIQLLLPELRGTIIPLAPLSHGCPRKQSLRGRTFLSMGCGVF